jgi:hypothetical protein
MAKSTKAPPATMDEVLVASFAAAGALAELLIEKGVITEQEYERKVSSQRKSYQRILKWVKESEAGSA